MSEYDEQATLFSEILPLYWGKYPILHWIHASLNGTFLHGRWGTINKAKASGMVSGVWDIFVPVAVHCDDGSDYCGLYIEMKYGNNKLTDNQTAFREAVGDAYEWATCYSAVEAANVIGEYLGIDELRCLK